MGGKYRVSKEVSGYINRTIRDGQSYWEPFVGAAWILQLVKANKRYASDINPYLIAMWQELQSGWVPPDKISEKQYTDIKNNKDKHPPELVSFVGFALSWGGKWFGGYARDSIGFNYALGGKRSLLKVLDNIIDVEFFVADFLETEPPESDMLIYCDPPYIDTTKYDYAPDFDHDAFWMRVRELGDKHCVLVSEYSAPDDFVCVMEATTTTGLRMENGSADRRVERLFSTRQVRPRIEQLSLFGGD